MRWSFSQLNPFGPRGLPSANSKQLRTTSLPIWLKCGGQGYTRPLFKWQKKIININFRIFSDFLGRLSNAANPPEIHAVRKPEDFVLEMMSNGQFVQHITPKWIRLVAGTLVDAQVPPGLEQDTKRAKTATSLKMCSLYLRLRCTTTTMSTHMISLRLWHRTDWRWNWNCVYRPRNVEFRIAVR